MRLNFLTLPAEERRLYIEQVAVRRRVSPMLQEKDFWVCWLLGLLFGWEFAGSLVPGSVPWTAEEDELVRTLPVEKVTRRTRRSLSGVYARRSRLQVPDGPRLRGAARRSVEGWRRLSASLALRGGRAAQLKG